MDPNENKPINNEPEEYDPGLPEKIRCRRCGLLFLPKGSMMFCDSCRREKEWSKRVFNLRLLGWFDKKQK